MNKLAEVQEGLEKAHDVSKREGKWSKVPEVKQFESKADLASLRRLVKDGAAKEKMVKGTPTKLFKPTRAGAGAIPGLDEGEEDRDRGKDPGKPRGKKPGRHGKKPGGRKPGRRGGKPDSKRPSRRRSEPKKPSGPPKGPRRGGNVSNNVRNTIGAGVATMLIGGMGSSVGGGGVGTPRGGTVGYIKGPM